MKDSMVQKEHSPVSRVRKSVQFEADDDIIDYKTLDTNNPRRSKRVWKKDRPQKNIIDRGRYQRIKTLYQDKSVSNLHVNVDFSNQRRKATHRNNESAE